MQSAASSQSSSETLTNWTNLWSMGIEQVCFSALLLTHGPRECLCWLSCYVSDMLESFLVWKESGLNVTLPFITDPKLTYPNLNSLVTFPQCTRTQLMNSIPRDSSSHVELLWCLKKAFLISAVLLIVSLHLTHYRSAMPFGNRKKIL